MPTIWLVHHGQTTYDAEGRVQGNLRTGLTDVGREEAHEAGRRLAQLADVSQVITSPMPRAIETGEIIAEHCFAPVDMDPGLTPWDEGYWTGEKHASVTEDMKWFAKHPGYVVPAGESFGTYIARYLKFLDTVYRTVKKNPKWVPVLVTHSMNIFAAPKLLNGEGGDLLGHDSIPNGGIVALHIEGERIRREDIPIKEAHNA